MAKQPPIINQINRTSGQLESLGRQIQSQKGCAEIINQFLAIKAGLNRVGGLILKEEFNHCSIKDRKKMEQLINNVFKIN